MPRRRLRIFALIFLLNQTRSLSLEKRQVDDDDEAVVVDAVSVGSESEDGPGPSVLGSVDNVFKAVKDFDQYRCLERMLCEYMQEEGDVASALLAQPLQALTSSPASSSSPTSDAALASSLLSSLFSSSSSNNRKSEFQTNFNSRPHHHHSPRPGPRPRPPDSRPLSSGGLVSSLSNLFFGSGGNGRRFKRQSNTQGNIIRLFQATGMDNLSMFPYIRAALIGHATRGDRTGVTRGTSTCSRMYRDCPTRADDLLDYLNNHNGGLFNQVEPSVNQEVAPIVSAILSDTLSNGQTTTQSSVFGAADQIFTNALVQGVSNYFINGDTGLGNILGGSGSSSTSSASGGILGSLTNIFAGKKR